MDIFEVKAKCPFYLCKDTKRVICEGIKSKAKELYFITDSDKDKWLNGICCDDYKSCSRFNKIMKLKYPQ